jgi:hypothetical protein
MIDLCRVKRCNRTATLYIGYDVPFVVRTDTCRRCRDRLARRGWTPTSR